MTGWLRKGWPFLATWLLGAVLALLRERLGPQTWVCGIPFVRWRQPVRPGDVLRARVGASSADGRTAFELLRDETPVASGSLVLRGTRL